MKSLKTILIIILLIPSHLGFAQNNSETLFNGVDQFDLPYNSENSGAETSERRKVLTDTDSITIVNQLKNLRPTIVNDLVNSPFGALDYSTKGQCFNVNDLSEIAIYGYLNLSQNIYLIGIAITPAGEYPLVSEYLLITDSNLKVYDWLCSSGSANGGNPNGNISRDYLIDPDKNIIISESSWGRNNISYHLEKEYRLFTSDENNEIKAEYHDIRSNGFEIIKVCLNL